MDSCRHDLRVLQVYFFISSNSFRWSSLPLFLAAAALCLAPAVYNLPRGHELPNALPSPGAEGGGGDGTWSSSCEWGGREGIVQADVGHKVMFITLLSTCGE